MTSTNLILVYSHGRGDLLKYAVTQEFLDAQPPARQNKFVKLGKWEDREALMAKYYAEGLQAFTRPVKEDAPKKVAPKVETPKVEPEAPKEMTMAEMRQACVDAGYPEEEWSSFKGKSGVKKMKEYLTSKV